MKKPYPCIESTLDITVRQGTIRLWIQEKEIKDSYMANSGYAKGIQSFIEEGFHRKNNIDIAEFIIREIPNVNAIQIIPVKGDSRGFDEGMVVYTVDFSSDVHG